MDSNSTVAIDGGGGGGDRLSKLSDATLGHILSFLPADEAARAAALSRRWRDVFPYVHTVSLHDPSPESDDDEDDDCYGCYTPGYGRCRRCAVQDRAAYFVNRVSAALLGRLRLVGGLAAAAPLRALRVRFHESGRPPHAAVVDMWLWYALQHAAAGDELHLDLRLRRDLPVCTRRYSLRGLEPLPAATAAGGVDEYVVPRPIFTCAALRTLRLAYCCLDNLLSSSAAVDLPSLETLHLTGVAGGDRAVERLVASCPRLAALTLEACAKVTALCVPFSARLRKLALRCCHDLAAVVVDDASELRAFEYRGAVPAAPSFLTLRTRGGRAPLAVSWCSLDFCGEEAAMDDPVHLAGLVDMLQVFDGVERLHLTSARLGCGAASLSPSAFPVFEKLRHLELTGIVPSDYATAVDVVARILERTPNLKILTLFFMPEPEPEPKQKYHGYHEEKNPHGHNLKYDERALLAVPDTELPCLRERMKEINLVHYQGGMPQRMLAKFLLCNAPAVQEVCGEFASGPFFVQSKLMEEIKGWVMNKSANI